MNAKRPIYTVTIINEHTTEFADKFALNAFLMGIVDRDYTSIEITQGGDADAQ